ncbi:MAG: hypothetical protein JWM89_3036 [Acidimicrobiales bacterium]|nr:hypothetical protein [Acidimicrobiales bacterium]
MDIPATAKADKMIVKDAFVLELRRNLRHHRRHQEFWDEKRDAVQAEDGKCMLEHLTYRPHGSRQINYRGEVPTLESGASMAEVEIDQAYQRGWILRADARPEKELR